MKDLKCIILEKLVINKNTKININDQNYDDVLNALYDYFSAHEEWPMDPGFKKLRSASDALEECWNIGDLIDLVGGWDELSELADIDSDELQEFISNEEDQLYNDLLQKLD